MARLSRKQIEARNSRAQGRRVLPPPAADMALGEEITEGLRTWPAGQTLRVRRQLRDLAEVTL
jgi:hypothetical protein